MRIRLLLLPLLVVVRSRLPPSWPAVLVAPPRV
jgi:hypothetical protein